MSETNGKLQVALVFPGQGSQSLDMVNDEFLADSIYAETYKKASEALGEDLVKKIKDEKDEAWLNDTRNTQPALLTQSVAVSRMLLAKWPNLPVKLVAGHSLGEYTALVVAGALSLEDGVKLVRLRGGFMQDALSKKGGIEGAMAAVIANDSTELVEKICAEVAKETGKVVSIANYNSENQNVVAGEKDAVEKVIEKLKENGVRKAVLLKVSVPSHCMLMEDAALEFKEHLDKAAIVAPKWPIVQNTSVKDTSDPAVIKTELLKQLHSPVRWLETCQHLKNEGVNALVECGPGKVLVNMATRLSFWKDDLQAANLGSIADIAAIGEKFGL